MATLERTSTAALTLAALGIIYGDIGTSPLYTMNEVFLGSGQLPITPQNVAGAASIIFWMLILVVSFKYAFMALRADHEGEGGVFALFGIMQQYKGRLAVPLSFMLMFAAGLLFGEGIITPAITVLSAVEGLKVAAPDLGHLVLPLVITILFLVFLFQKRGTAQVAKVYGPIMFVWFASLALLGIRQIVQYPSILLDVIDPRSATHLLFSIDGKSLMWLIGAAFLAITGSEALYADLGHLGKRAVRMGWFAIVLPALVLNYAGQGAYLLRGGAIHGNNLFFSIVPDILLYPMIALATAAAIIASVALIFGIYSLTSQAIALNLFPRLKILHTNWRSRGQIYIPAINWALCFGSVSLVLIFGSVTRLAAAYGFAVAGVMLSTSITLMAVSIQHWRWHPALAVPVFGSLILLDSGFVIANSLKFADGGYIPFSLGVCAFFIIATWRWGRRIMRRAYDGYVAERSLGWYLDIKKRVEDAGGILHDSRRRSLATIDRAVIFLISRPIKNRESRVPVKVRLHLKRLGAIPKNILFLNIEVMPYAYVKRHYEIVELAPHVYAVHAIFGFMESPDASKVIRDLYKRRLFDKGFRRCAIEVSEDEFIIDKDLPLRYYVLARFFKYLYKVSLPRYRYFGLRGTVSAGLSKTVVPVRVCARGVRIEIPEFPLHAEHDAIDPDTLEQIEPEFVPIREMYRG
jgi:KUP system potassium uptake protein